MLLYELASSTSAKFQRVREVLWVQAHIRQVNDGGVQLLRNLHDPLIVEPLGQIAKYLDSSSDRKSGGVHGGHGDLEA